MFEGFTPRRILMAHGDGGRFTYDLVKRVFLPAFRSQHLKCLTDGARLPNPGGDLVFSTDCFVVSPPFFPGGDIGKLSVAGTVNDVAVMGAEPVFVSASFVLEEGFEVDDLERIVASMAETASAAGVEVVTGDTKVVEKGKGDEIFICTTGIGFLPSRSEGESHAEKHDAGNSGKVHGAVKARVPLGYEFVRPGDVIVINGYIGDHGIAVLSARHGLEFETSVASDCMPLAHLVKAALAAAGGVFSGEVRFMRDPTRGGLATVLKELAMANGRIDVVVEEQSIPVRREVQAAADMLGLDPMYLPNEGKVVMVVSPEASEAVLQALRTTPGGEYAAVIGEVRAGSGGAYLKTPYGGTKILDLLAQAELPRIC